MTINVATTIPNNVILQLSNALNIYSATPAYPAVVIVSAQNGGVNSIDDNFWTNWKAENSANPLLVNGQIFEV